MLWVISQKPRSRLSFDPTTLDAGFILGKLESLLDNDFFEESLGDGFALISHGTIPSSEIHRSIIYSIVNTFAGLQDIPAAVVLSMLRIDPKISSHLFKYIQSDDLTIAKPLADYLLGLPSKRVMKRYWVLSLRKLPAE
jgi:hypothetical protein